MAGNVQSWSLIALSCLMLTVESQSDRVSPPENLSLQWIHAFKPRLSWDPVHHPGRSCEYEVAVRDSDGEELNYQYTHTVIEPLWTDYTVMEGGRLLLSVTNICDGIRSDTRSCNVTEPELVKDLKCSIHSLERTHCSWRPASAASNISFYYDLVDESGATGADDDDVPSFRECPSYTYTDGVRTGCNLQAHRIEIAVHIIINGSSKNGHNTFKRKLWKSVMPPKLNVTLNKTKDHLYITWNRPDIGDEHKWTFEVKYNTCKAEELNTGNERSSMQALGSTCPYRVQVKGRYRDGGETPWSDVYEAKADEEADEEADSNALIYASIIIPITLAVLVVLACVCCQRNKHIIFPKVPEPRDFLSEISNNNNNKSTADNLYIPEKEEENCEIILVTDPQDKQAALMAHAC